MPVSVGEHLVKVLHCACSVLPCSFDFRLWSDTAWPLLHVTDRLQSLNQMYIGYVLSSELLLESSSKTNWNTGFISWEECCNIEVLCDWQLPWSFSVKLKKFYFDLLESDCTTVLVVERNFNLSLVTLLKFRTVWDLVAHLHYLIKCTFNVYFLWMISLFFERNTIKKVLLSWNWLWNIFYS